MKEPLISFLIPARNEVFLKNTVEDLIKNCSQSEIIVTLDGTWSDPELEQHERVNIVYVNKAIGQRAATNLACKLARAKYVCKIDAHCAFDKDWDIKMVEAFKKTGDNTTMVSVMRNLWAFDWKCYSCGWKIYQANGTEGMQCGDCNSRKMRRKIIWRGKTNPQSTSYCFNNEPRFMYFEDWKHRPQYIEDKENLGVTETMSIQGSCFMLTRKKYWELNICDENFGSWGNQGIEVVCKTWLTGGRVLVNHKTWYAHLFRTNQNLKFPWPVSGREQLKTKAKVRKFIWEGKIPGQIHPVSWLVERFAPIPGWDEKDVEKLKATEKSFK